MLVMVRPRWVRRWEGESHSAFVVYRCSTKDDSIVVRCWCRRNKKKRWSKEEAKNRMTVKGFLYSNKRSLNTVRPQIIWRDKSQLFPRTLFFAFHHLYLSIDTAMIPEWPQMTITFSDYGKSAVTLLLMSSSSFSFMHSRFPQQIP